MREAYVLLKCIGKAVVKNVVNLVSFGVGGDILVDAWEYWQEASKEEERPAQVAAVARLSPAELREEVARIVREEAARLSPEQRTQVAAYLEQVPATIRRSLRASEDPTGGPAAAGSAFRKPEDLRPLLPTGLPRFKVGDRPLPGVDWELEELLGVGGFGEVWKARNPHFNGVAPVALKFCLDPAAKSRLLRHEAALLNRLMCQQRFDGIVPLLQSYLNADPPCLVYEYVDGGDLARLIQSRSGGLQPRLANQIMELLTVIVGHAHRLNPPIVHRDLKPANILMKQRPGGKLALRITDFGIGGLAVQKAVEQSRMGTQRPQALATAMRGSYTPLYASPQQMRGDDPDPRDDVYALGVIWHQMLTGDLTSGGGGGEAWGKRLTDAGMTPALVRLLASCLETERKDRPANAMALGEKLERLIREPAHQSQQASREDKRRLPRLNGWTWAGLAAAPLLLIVVLAACYLFRPKPHGNPDTARVADASPVKDAAVTPHPSGTQTPLTADPGQEPAPDKTPPQDGSKEPPHGDAPSEVEVRPVLKIPNPVQEPKTVDPADAPAVTPPAPAPGSADQKQTEPLPNTFKNSLSIEFVLVPKGKSWLGGGGGKPGEKEVDMPNDLYLGEYLVTQGEWQSIMGNNPSSFARTGDRKNLVYNIPDGELKRFPVDSVSWDDAQLFVAEVNKRAKEGGWVYRLPTEAEWEYACRGGPLADKRDSAFYFYFHKPTNRLLSGQANFNSVKGRTCKVGSYPPNQLGLYDMHGNVWEWCQDEGPDPNNPTASARRTRGGSWDSGSEGCWAVTRDTVPPSSRRFNLGLRLTRVPADEQNK